MLTCMRLRLDVARIRRPARWRLFGPWGWLGAVLGMVAFWPAAAHATTGYVVVSGANEIVPLGGGSPIAVGENPEAIAVTPDGGTAYVQNHGSGTVTPVDVATGTTSAPIRVASPGESSSIGSGSSTIAITPDGSRAYVLSSSGLTPIDLARGAALTPIQVPASAIALGIAPDGMTAFVVDDADGTVVPIDLRTGVEGSPIPAGTSPHAIAITPDGRTAYVVDDSTVTPIDLMTDTPQAPIQTGGQGLRDVAIAPDGQTAYLADAQGHLIPIDVASDTAGPPITLVACPQELFPGYSCDGAPHGGIAITPDGQTAYVMELCIMGGHCFGGQLYSVNLATLRVSSGMSFGPVFYTPNPSAVVMVPGPSASLSATAAPAGQASSFTATATNPGGSVSGYMWSFGDGTTAAGSSTVSHVYAKPGPYTVTLSTTNQGGCATALVFTGRTAYCNGLQTVHASRVVDLVGPPTASITSPRTGPVLKILTRRVLAANGRARITLACSKTRWQRTGCRGILTLTRTFYGRRHQALTLVLARTRYNLPIGARRTFSLRLSRRALTLLHRARNHRFAARTRATLTEGRTTIRSLTIAR